MKTQIYHRRTLEIIFDTIAQCIAHIADVKTRFGLKLIRRMKYNVKTAVSVKLSNFTCYYYEELIAPVFLFNVIHSYGLNFVKYSLKVLLCSAGISGFYYSMHPWYGLS